jgi:hypothetical protein
MGEEKAKEDKQYKTLKGGSLHENASKPPF